MLESDGISKGRLSPTPILYQCRPPIREDQASLVDLLHAAGRKWMLVALLTILGTAAAAWYAWVAPPVFRAEAMVAPPERQRSSAASVAVSALGGLGAELAGGMGLSLSGTDANRLEALLKSHRLIQRVLRKHPDLTGMLFPTPDAETPIWIRLRGLRNPPDLWAADKLVHKIMSVKNDARANILAVSIELRTPEEATRALVYFLDELAGIVQEDELSAIRSKQDFIQDQLRKTSDPLLLAKLETLLSDQIEKSMLAQNRGRFAFEMIDPPASSNKRVRPRRVAIVAAGGVFSLGFGLTLGVMADLRQGGRRPSARCKSRVQPNPEPRNESA